MSADSRTPDVEDMAPVAFLVTPLAKRCLVKGCRARVSEVVAVADADGVIGADSLLTASCCGEPGHRRVIREGLSKIVVKARLANDYGPGATTLIGPGIELTTSGREPS